MDNKILESIKAGELEHQKQLEEQKSERSKQEKARLKWIELCKLIAADWARVTLPTLIKEETAKGIRILSLGSSDYDNPDHNILCKVKEAELLGLKIIESSYEADPGEEGCYSHGAGCSYSISW